jgi:rod shape-determining protein MreC
VRYKTYLVLLALLLVLIWVNFKNPSSINAVKPRVTDFLELPFKAATKAFGGLYDLATLRNRYEDRILALEGRLSAMTKSAIQAKELLSENERLRAMLGLRTRFASRIIAAQVIARDQSGWNTFIIIDKGKKDGILPDMPVIKPDGLIGRVYDAGNSTAKVILIDNPNSKMAVTIQRTREQGVMVGMGAGFCKMLYLSYETQAQTGDPVIASELGNLSVKGYLVGEIVKVIKDPKSLYASAVIRPASNLFKLEEVLCVE